MLRTPMQTARSVAPHLAIFLGLAVMLAVLGFNLLGDGLDGLRDVLDPRLRR
jgi:peptide/nickel transport system permease protein